MYTYANYFLFANNNSDKMKTTTELAKTCSKRAEAAI